MCSTQGEPSPALRSAASGEGVVPRSSGEGCLSGAVTLSQGTQQPTATPTQGSGGINVPAPAPPPGAPANAPIGPAPQEASGHRSWSLQRWSPAPVQRAGWRSMDGGSGWGGGASRRAPAASRIPTPEMAVPSPVLEAVTALTMANTRRIKVKGSPREHASEIYCRARSPSPQSAKCHGRHRGQAAAKSRRQRKPREPCGLPSRHSPQLRGTQERFRE